MKIKKIILLSLTVFLPLLASAQDGKPGVSPSATYINDDGKETKGWEDFAGQAPLEVTFSANPRNMEAYSPVYEWHFQREGEEHEMMVRYEEITQYTFTETGTVRVTLKVKLNGEADEPDSTAISITISVTCQLIRLIKIKEPTKHSVLVNMENVVFARKFRMLFKSPVMRLMISPTRFLS